MPLTLRRLAVIAAIVAAPIALLMLVNAFDETLSPEAQALFARPGAPYSRDSGWALMAGFNAPAGKDPREHGESLRKLAVGHRGARQAVEGELEIRAAAELLCTPESIDCVRSFAQRPESIVELAADNALLLSRYDELARSANLRDVSEALDFYEPTGYFQAVVRTQVVRLSQIGAAAGSGKVDVALAWLDADALFFRRWLDEAGSILTKMIAVRGLSRDLLLAGQIARSGRALGPAQWEALERVVAPLTPTQRGVAPVQRSEAWFFAQVLDLMVAQPRATSEIIAAPRLMSAILSATAKRNATLNFAQPLFSEWMALDAIPSDAIDSAIEGAKSRNRRAVEPSASWIYNYAGKSFTAESSPDLGEYIYRVRDLDALASLVRCAIAFRRDTIAREGAPAFIAASPACRDPYGGTFAWDAKDPALSFRTRSTGTAKRFGGNGDRVTFAVYPAAS